MLNIVKKSIKICSVIKPINIRYLSKKIYNDQNEWLLTENDTTKIGLSYDAINQLGELVYLDFPHNIGDKFNKDDELSFIESIKAVGEIRAPFDCELVNNNLDLENDLERLMKEPENDNNWIIEIKNLK